MAALAAGDVAHAARWVNLATEAVGGQVTAPQGFLRRTRMRLHAARGRTDLALMDGELAATCFVNQGRALDAGQTTAAVATLLIDANRQDEARVWLGRAADLADRCGSAQLHGRVRRQQDRPVPRRSDVLAGLTHREREIAALVSSGMTSMEIARSLFLSVRTVDTHLGRIYRKLGLPNRASLARFVLHAANE